MIISLQKRMKKSNSYITVLTFKFLLSATVKIPQFAFCCCKLTLANCVIYLQEFDISQF